MKTQLFALLVLLGAVCGARGDTVLIGLNLPHQSVLDGDFDTIISGWRHSTQHLVRHLPKRPPPQGIQPGRQA